MASIDYFYSVRSSFAYLGAARIAEIARRHGRTLVHRPVRLAVVVPPIAGAPLDQRPPLRVAYARTDLLRWAAFLELEVQPEPIHHYGPLELPSGVVIAAQRMRARGQATGDVDELSRLILEALWRHDRDIGSERIIADLCNRAGFDPAVLMPEGMSDTTQLELERNGREAVMYGVMGSPSYFVDGENFYGQDRLDFVERKLAGR